jgi:hypothetical protein
MWTLHGSSTFSKYGRRIPKSDVGQNNTRIVSKGQDSAQMTEFRGFAGRPATTEQKKNAEIEPKTSKVKKI